MYRGLLGMTCDVNFLLQMFSGYVIGRVDLYDTDLPCTLGEVGGPVFNAHLFQVSSCESRATTLTYGFPAVSISICMPHIHQGKCDF